MAAPKTSEPPGSPGSSSSAEAVTDAEREKAQAERHARTAKAKQRKDDVLEAVLGMPLGREFIERVIYEFGSLKALGFNVDPHLRDFHAGQRAVGQAVDRECRRVSPDGWALMENARTERIRLEPLELPPDDEDE